MAEQKEEVGRELLIDWISALKSGAFTPFKGALRSVAFKQPKFNAFGVLCQLYDDSRWEKTLETVTVYRYSWYSARENKNVWLYAKRKRAPTNLLREMGLTAKKVEEINRIHTKTKVADLFPAVAKYLESHLESLNENSV